MHQFKWNQMTLVVHLVAIPLISIEYCSAEEVVPETVETLVEKYDSICSDIYSEGYADVKYVANGDVKESTIGKLSTNGKITIEDALDINVVGNMGSNIESSGTIIFNNIANVSIGSETNKLTGSVALRNSGIFISDGGEDGTADGVFEIWISSRRAIENYGEIVIRNYSTVDINGKECGIFSDEASKVEICNVDYVNINGNTPIDSYDSQLNIVANRDININGVYGSYFSDSMVSLESKGGSITVTSSNDGVFYLRGDDATTLNLTGDLIKLQAAEGKNAITGCDTAVVNFHAQTAGKGYINIDGRIAMDGTIAIDNQTIEMSDDSEFIAGTVVSNNGKIVYNSPSNSIVRIENIKIYWATNNKLFISQSGKLNDQYGSADQAYEAALQQVKVGPGGEGKYILSGEAGSVSPAWRYDPGDSDDGDSEDPINPDDGGSDMPSEPDDGNDTPQKPDNSNDDSNNSSGTPDGDLVIVENPSMEVLSNFNAMTLSQWRFENNHISERLGDVRDNLGKVGAWARVYGSESKLRDTVTTMKTKIRSVQVGSDVTVGKNWIVGAAFTYTNLDSDFSNGSGDSDGYSLAAYLSGLFDCGGYFDLVGRVGRLSADVTASTLSTDGGVFKGSYDNTAFGISAEVGYRLPFAKTFYVEPQAELAYGYVMGDKYYSASNGVTMDQDDFQSLVGRLGARLGATFAEGAGSIYLTASVNHDFLGDADATATPAKGATRKLGSDLGGTWFSYGIGAQFNPTENLSLYGKLARSNGDEYQEDYKFTAGVRYQF